MDAAPSTSSSTRSTRGQKPCTACMTQSDGSDCDGSTSESTPGASPASLKASSDRGSSWTTWCLTEETLTASGTASAKGYAENIMQPRHIEASDGGDVA
jgi:hypothetical protein